MLKVYFRERLNQQSLICLTKRQNSGLSERATLLRQAWSSTFRFSTKEGSLFPKNFLPGSPIPPSFLSRTSSLEYLVRKGQLLVMVLPRILYFSTRVALYSTCSVIEQAPKRKVKRGRSLSDLSSEVVSSEPSVECSAERDLCFLSKKVRIDLLSL